MKSALGYFLAGILVVATSCTGPTIGQGDDLGTPDPGAAELGPAVDPDWSTAAAYLDSLFDSQQQLCREFPGASTFWTARDNALAARALSYLPMADPTHSAAIIARLQLLKSCGCGDDPGHDGLINHHIDPVVNKGAMLPLQPRSACVRTPRLVPMAGNSCSTMGGQCVPAGQPVLHEDYADSGWTSDACQAGACNVMPIAGWDEEGQGFGHAELLALQILSRKNRGLDVMPMWQNLLSKWDGKGLRDRVTVNDGKYMTYKLALFKICARVLGQPLPVGVDHKLAEAQNRQGGFRTFYDLSGQFTLDQLGNTETTAYVILAFRKPTTDF